MVDSNTRGSEKPEDSELGLKRLEALLVKMAQDSSESKQEKKQDIGELTDNKCSDGAIGQNKSGSQRNESGNQCSGDAAGPHERGVQGRVGGSKMSVREVLKSSRA